MLFMQVFSPAEAELATNTLHDVKERKSLTADVERLHVVSFRKQELNNFLTCCRASPVREVDIGLLSTTTERTRRRNISEVSRVMVLNQLRLLNQDAAHTDCIDCLNNNSILLIEDWAMKFLPWQYQESQGEWFAKKGFSWHITVAIRKKESEMQTQAFVHVADQCNQDSPRVVMLMEHVLATLKKETLISTMPFIIKTTQVVIMLHTLF